MSADGSGNHHPKGAVALKSRGTLEPVQALRAPLGGVRGAPPPSLLAPQVVRLEDELSAVRKSLRAQRAETRVEKQNNARLRAEIQSLREYHNLPVTAASSDTASAEGTTPQCNTVDLANLNRLHEEEMARLRLDFESRASQLEARCAREIAQLEAKQEAKVSALRNSLRASEELTLAKSERIRRLEARLSRMQVGEAEVRALKPSTDGVDDFTALRGVGPVYALALRRHGVVSFAQIGAWTLEDIRTIAPKIGTTDRRILREEWVPQARKFDREYGASKK